MNIELHRAAKPPYSNKSHWQFTLSQRRQLYDEVTPYYEQVHRSYHDIGHINYMLEAHEVKYGYSAPDSMFLSILFHDIVWMPNSSPAVEKMSFELVPVIYSRVMNRSPIPKRLLSLVEGQIMATTIANHLKDQRNSTLSEMELRMLDLDLLKMADSWHNFLTTQFRVHCEVRHIGTKQQQISGTQAFFKKFIDRGFVFYTKEMQDLNPLAILNLKARHEQLRHAERSLQYKQDRNELASMYDKRHSRKG